MLFPEDLQALLAAENLDVSAISDNLSGMEPVLVDEDSEKKFADIWYALDTPVDDFQKDTPVDDFQKDTPVDDFLKDTPVDDFLKDTPFHGDLTPSPRVDSVTTEHLTRLDCQNREAVIPVSIAGGSDKKPLRKRQKMAALMQSLQKEIPFAKKKRISMLDDAFEYATFLNAQINVLQTMPSHSSSAPPSDLVPSHPSDGDFDPFRKSKGQLLEFLLSSQMIQNELLSIGFAVAI